MGYYTGLMRDLVPSLESYLPIYNKETFKVVIIMLCSHPF